MKKLIVVAAVLLTMGVAKANAGVSFEISVGDRHHGGRGHSHHHGRVERHYKPHYAPRYVVRECCSYPGYARYYYGRPVHRHSHHHGGHYGGHRGGHGHDHGHRH